VGRAGAPAAHCRSRDEGAAAMKAWFKMNDSPQKNVHQAGQWEECSTNLDLDVLPSFLEEIIPLINAGFGACEAQRVL
jgi:hypothetical protein